MQHAWWITTNLAFGEWPKVFGGDEKLTTALLDRLAEHAAIITTRGRSFRMRRRSETPAQVSSTGAPAATESTTRKAKATEKR